MKEKVRRLTRRSRGRSIVVHVSLSSLQFVFGSLLMARVPAARA